MGEQPTSPKIMEASWGRLLVEGIEAPFRDVKLFPGGAMEWDWTKTGTRHEPGIQPADLVELIDHGAKVVVLATGMEQRLQVKAETYTWLAAREIQVSVLPTEGAVELYNDLAERELVGALIHSTC